MTNLTKQLFDLAGIKPKRVIEPEKPSYCTCEQCLSISPEDYTVKEIYPDLESNTPEAAWNRERLEWVILNTTKPKSYTLIIEPLSHGKFIYIIYDKQLNDFEQVEKTRFKYTGLGYTRPEALLSLAIKIVDEIKDELQAVEWGW